VSAAPHLPRRSDLGRRRSASTPAGGGIEDSNGYDFVVNTAAGPGGAMRALNVNTGTECPIEGFTNRSPPRLAGGGWLSPDRGTRSLDGW
jgi:hypothetical protein